MPYASAPEMFDASYRASASSMLSFLGRIADIVAPFASQKYIDDGSNWCSLAWRRWYLGVSLAYVLLPVRKVTGKYINCAVRLCFLVCCCALQVKHSDVERSVSRVIDILFYFEM